MPPKQTPKTLAKPQRQSLPLKAKAIKVGQAFAYLLLAGVGAAVSQLNLSPVYGSIPASLYHQKAITGTALLAFMLHAPLKRRFPPELSQFAAPISYWSIVIQFFLFKFSSQLGAVFGPIVTELLTYFPALFLAIHSAMNMLDFIDLSSWNRNIAEMAPAVGSYAIVSSTSKIATVLLPNFVGTHGLISRIRLQLVIGSGYAALSSTLASALLCVPAMIHTVKVNPHFNSEAGIATLNQTLHSYNYSILARQESNTGYVSVLESANDNFRVMRCDHSLLGGNWLATPERIARGQTMDETIYSVFTMLEAVRLVEVRNTAPDSEKSALVIGLGIGTAPTALINHGINTTIVELDPMVHYYATEYFGLPKNHTAAIQDAITFVDEVATYAPASYDYVIHDVFTGGAEPVPLFTLEFLQGLKAVLKKDGVIAINYAGDIALTSTQTVLNTIHHIFPTCRIFRDSEAAAKEPSSDSGDFTNMIVFCLNHDEEGYSGEKPTIKFRTPTESDFKGSIARRYNLLPHPELEIKYKPTPEEGETLLKRSSMGKFAENQRNSVLDHWKIMRTVLPDGVWENW